MEPWPALDHRHRDQPEREDLHPALDGVRHVLQFGGGQDEHRVGRGLLQDLEQRVEGAAAHHVHFVDDVDPVAAEGGPGLHLFAQGAGVLHRGARGRVDLHDVQVLVGQFRRLAGVADAAGRGGRAFLAVQGPGQDARGGGLAGAAHPGEQERLVVDGAAVGLGAQQRVGQGLDAGFLAHQIGEQAGTVFEGEGGHRRAIIPRRRWFR